MIKNKIYDAKQSGTTTLKDITSKKNIENSCQNSKKSVSISAQYKPTHNKSEIGHKQKSCPLHKKKKIEDPESFPSFGSEHLIKTY